MIVRKIESKLDQRRKRVAAYVRVSTAVEEQQESLRTQAEYYSRFIQHSPMWEYVKVYADPGRSGLNAKHRSGFQAMLEDAKAGKIDVILVKSISRFARNVADAQRYVHELKSCDVEVRFEREAISSFDSASDMIFGILAAVAQEESRSISENVKWSYRKHAEKGIRRLGNHRVLGYDTNRSGKLVPNGDAWIINLIFERYADGAPMASIQRELNEKGAKRMRCDEPFNAAIILYILRNEIYRGDRLLQKAAPHNYLTKKPDIAQSYTSSYINSDHEPIVSEEIWERAQARLANTQDERASGISRRENAHFLYGMVFCSKCGSPYTRRTVRGKGGMQAVWKCADRVKGQNGNGCEGAIIAENDLLKLLADKLGWAWTDAEHFDARALAAIVKQIVVMGTGCQLEKR